MARNALWSAGRPEVRGLWPRSTGVPLGASNPRTSGLFRLGAICAPIRRKTMWDVLYVGVTLAFFALCVAYVRGCERL
jgi:hypothetical protein